MKNIRKISVLLAAILAASTLFCACAQKQGEAPMGFKEISHDSLPYNLYVPDEWITDISTGMTAAYYSNADRANISMITFSLGQDDPKTIEEYWENYEPQLKTLFTKFELVGEPDEFKLDEVDATAYTYTGTLAAETNAEYKFMQVIAYKDAEVYIFTYTAETSKYDSHLEDVWAILGYFDFT